jgi:hypothetical protein
MSSEPEKVGRRHFLRLVSGATVGATVAGSSLLSGCGSGKGTIANSGGNNGGSNNSGSGGNNNGGGNVGGVVPPDTRAAALQTIRDFQRSVAGQARDVQRTRLADFLRTRSEFIGSGVNEDGVWAVFSDGVPYMFLDNRRPDPAARSVPAPPSSVSRGTDLPGSRTARLINTMGSAYENEVPQMRPFLENNAAINGGGESYRVVVDPGTVESLRILPGDGVFYMSSHGGKCTVPLLDDQGRPLLNSQNQPRTIDTFGIWTSTVADARSLPIYLDDLRSGRLGIGTALVRYDTNGNDVEEDHYWITARWIEKYVQFGKDSLVWFSACKSNSAISQAFVQMCLNKGAGLYVGWDNWVLDSGCIAAGKFLFDRLTGANRQNPVENPPQRPFDYENVWNDLRKRGLHKHPDGEGGTTEIVYTANSARSFGLLNPAISYVLVNEVDEEATLRGQFGKPAEGERKVLVGGREATIKAWQEDRIRIHLPQTGDGSQGDVQVIVREHKSNIRQITAWEMNFRYKWTNDQHPELIVEGPMRLRFRADVGTYREKPGEAPKEVLRSSVATKESRLELTASGTAHQGQNTTITWSQSQVFVSAFSNAGETTIIANFLMIDTFLQKAQLGLAMGALTPPFLQTITTREGTSRSGFATAFGLLNEVMEFPNPREDLNAPPIPLPALDLTIDNRFNIAAGTHTPPALPFLRLEWDAAPAQSPPDPQAARSVSHLR